ncbi:DUF3944 domain-containing protein [Phocoenobacter skyensis]|uniref:DUF3944 domain-containing protein n=1 Tax=Phocoenobacter skyensis TaxID=97481 RepID=A0A1H7TWW9_9PAST|nr:DUF3944 domain-containing protein [Pasteurella skyensis]MDP8078645.1 DUF3944 domain-containing protein [Pasteurella skyensis]MDP8084639.1 DUF3944 domain-containing protein [Pasteurella skyensis]MDP8184215.1 DUF3944 domain-containing protein [Pasteurella skyensis]QLB22868.1 hypothetical protein A6B44_06460 [Pasteurella skyensis]SEL89241.1 Uncharacterized protein YaaW, UPF0174 family [Pasteurella skyensis]
MAYRYDADLEFLANCENEDLQPLVDILTKDKDGKKRYTEGLTKTKEYKTYYPDHQKYWKEIIADLQTFGANTFVTLVRGGKGVTYREILCDVCDTLKVNFNKESATALIEKNLLDKVLEKSIEELSEEELNAVAEKLNIPTENMGKQALTSAVLVGIRKTMTTPVFLELGWGIFGISTVGTLLAGTTFGRILGAATGPIGWGLTGAWTLMDIASPAKRVTVPAVIQIAFLRRKYS